VSTLLAAFLRTDEVEPDASGLAALLRARRATLRYVSNPLSLRLADPIIERLRSRAARSHLPPRTLAQRYIDEGLRRDEHPAVHFVDGPAGRRAALLGTGMDVWEVVLVVHDNGGDAVEAATYLELPVHVVHAAAAYYAAYRDEIDRWIEANEREAEEAHAAWLARQRAFGSETAARRDAGSPNRARTTDPRA